MAGHREGRLHPGKGEIDESGHLGQTARFGPSSVSSVGRGFFHLAVRLESVETAGDPCQIAGQARVRPVAALASEVASSQLLSHQSCILLVLIAPIVRIWYMSCSCCPNRLDDGPIELAVKVVSRSICQH